MIAYPAILKDIRPEIFERNIAFLEKHSLGCCVSFIYDNEHRYTVRFVLDEILNLSEETIFQLKEDIRKVIECDLAEGMSSIETFCRSVNRIHDAVEQGVATTRWGECAIAYLMQLTFNETTHFQKGINYIEIVRGGDDPHVSSYVLFKNDITRH